MDHKRVVLVGTGLIMGIVKFYLTENNDIDLAEIAPADWEELFRFIKLTQPNCVILERSPKTCGFLERLLMVSKVNNIKVVEVNPDNNTVEVLNWSQVVLEHGQDLLAVL